MVSSQSGDQRCALGIIRRQDRSLLGVVPVQVSRYALRYEVGSRALCKLPLRVVQILGSQPLIPAEEDLHVPLVRGILSAFPDCDGIDMHSVPLDSSWGRTLRQSEPLRRSALVYLPEGLTDSHFISLPDSFDEYLAKFKSKTRNTLRRNVRRLREHGKTELVRVEHEQGVETFLDVAARLSSQSRQCRARGWRFENTPAECQKLLQLARAGVLRSYYLRCGDEVCAYVNGFQYHDIYYYNRIGFDERFAQFSPGTVLLYLLLEDLFQHRRPSCVNLYPGEWSYKEMFATECPPEMRVLLLRRTLAHRLQIGCHAALHGCLGLAKRCLRGQRP
jgi:hypothetical protein